MTISYSNLLRVGVRNACPNDLGRVSTLSNTTGPTYAWGDPRALIGKRRPLPNLEPNRHVSGADYNAIVEKQHFPILEEVRLSALCHGDSEPIIFQGVFGHKCQDFVVLPLVYRPASESQLTMST